MGSGESNKRVVEVYLNGTKFLPSFRKSLVLEVVKETPFPKAGVRIITHLQTGERMVPSANENHSLRRSGSSALLNLRRLVTP